MNRIAIWTGTLALVCSCFLSQSNVIAQPAPLTPHTQDFESLDINDTTVAPLGDAGWLVGANVFEPGGGFLYNYFAFPAPNDGFGFTQLASGAQGPNQGMQYLNTFSDYNNGDHDNGFTIDCFIFREGEITMDNLGVEYEFKFDFRRADDPFGPAGSQTTAAYYRVLDPVNGFATIEEGFVDTTNATFDWSENNTISITIDPTWAGFILQYGFNNNGTNFDSSGVYYDNVSFDEPGKGCKNPLGDVNLDGEVDLLDVQPFVNILSGGGAFQCEADINEDGSVDLLDVQGFVNILSGN